MHDDGLRTRERQAFRSETILREVAIRSRQIRLPHALFLNPQHHHDVNIFEPTRKRCVTRTARELVVVRHQHARSDDAKVSDTQSAKRVKRRARNARVPNVSNDCNGQTLEALLVLAHGERVEQTLRWMRDVRLSRRQYAYMRRHICCNESWNTRLGIAYHHHIDVQRLESVDRVQHALALDARGQLHFKVDDVGSEPLGRKLE